MGVPPGGPVGGDRGVGVEPCYQSIISTYLGETMENTRPDPAGDFAEVWGDVSRKLRGVLLSRRVPARVVDDLVQDTGLRLFRHWDRVDHSTVWALALTIASNLIRDEMRKEARHPSPTAPLESADRPSLDFEEQMLTRLELRRVRKAIRSLSPSDRTVLLALARFGGLRS